MSNEKIKEVSQLIAEAFFEALEKLKEPLKNENLTLGGIEKLARQAEYSLFEEYPEYDPETHCLSLNINFYVKRRGLVAG